jgi:hypothetical protein
MGFKEIRALLIEALQSEQYDSEPRADIGDKNLLSTEEVTSEFVIRLLRRCAGWEYSTSRHHTQDVDCHIFTPSLGGQSWYIKVYLRNGWAVFISVHQ